MYNDGPIQKLERSTVQPGFIENIWELLQQPAFECQSLGLKIKWIEVIYFIVAVMIIAGIFTIIRRRRKNQKLAKQQSDEAKIDDVTDASHRASEDAPDRDSKEVADTETTQRQCCRITITSLNCCRSGTPTIDKLQKNGTKTVELVAATIAVQADA